MTLSVWLRESGSERSSECKARNVVICIRGRSGSGFLQEKIREVVSVSEGGNTTLAI